MDQRPLLICYDGSEDAKRAIAAAATSFSGWRAVILDVGPLQVVAEAYAAAGSGAAELDQLVFDAAEARADAGAAPHADGRESGVAARAPTTDRRPMSLRR